MTVPPFIFAYARHPSSPRRSLDEQTKAIDAYRAAHCKGCHWVGVFTDRDRGKSLFSRQAAICLNQGLRRGDHLIVADCGVVFGSLRELSLAIRI
jgi:hypothetical protein